MNGFPGMRLIALLAVGLAGLPTLSASGEQPVRFYPHPAPAQRSAAVYTQYCRGASVTLKISETRGLKMQREVQLTVQDRPASRAELSRLTEALAGFSAISGVTVLCLEQSPVGMDIHGIGGSSKTVMVRFSGSSILDIH